MSSNQFTQESPSRGGLAVVVICFLVFGFLVTFAAQFLFNFFLSGQQVLSKDASEMIADATADAIVEPESHYSPEEVVSFQLEGLGSANRAVGIGQCFAFASPSNKTMTGPLSRFALMVQKPPYDVLINPRELLIGSSEIHEDRATVTVSLLDSFGEVQVFLFLLSRQQQGEFSGCWMTEGVFPLHRINTRESARPPTVVSPLILKSISRARDSAWCLPTG